jgi:hypothetical protein
MVVALTLVGTPASTAIAKRASCYGNHHWKTVASNAKVRVFYRELPDQPEDLRYYGCLRSNGKRTWLGDLEVTTVDSSGPGSFRLRGELVGYEYSSCYDGGCVIDVETDDLRTGKRIRHFVQRSADATAVVDLRIAKSGSLGVMESASPDAGSGPPYTNTVISVTSEGATVLDSGLDVDADSLALGGSWLYWTRAGEPHSAPLP